MSIFSFGAFLTPCVSCVKSFSEMNCTGSESTGGTSIGCAEIATSAQPSATA